MNLMNMNTNKSERLQQYGWNEYWASCINEEMIRNGFIPARVIAQFTNQYRIITADGESVAEVSGKFQFQAAARSDYPGVGDWTVVQPLQGEARAVIHAVLPRRSAMIRKAAGSVPEEQVIGANLDTLFIVNALNDDFNVRKIERYLITAWESGATPVVLLTKADLCEDTPSRIADVCAAAPGVAVHAVSALQDEGKEDLAAYMLPGHTLAVTGSSGVGKSTLLNWLAGDNLQHVQGIREQDARGRHTTTHRELFPLPCGAVMMDTPGMRELQLWEASGGWQEAFADIEEIAAGCRFRDCTHGTEEGCAIKQAIEEGTLDARRFGNYKKTGRELAHQARKEQSVSKRQQKSSKKRLTGRFTSNDRKNIEME